MQKTCCLSSPFSAHACMANAAVQPEDDSLGEKRKREEPSKRTPFKRKVPLKGRPRSYKIRMIPTKEQVVELKRCFAAARVAYNFANKRVRDDKAPANTISLKKDWVRAGQELKDSTSGVASRFMNQAIKDLVQA